MVASRPTRSPGTAARTRSRSPAGLNGPEPFAGADSSQRQTVRATQPESADHRRDRQPFSPIRNPAHGPHGLLPAPCTPSGATGASTAPGFVGGNQKWWSESWGSSYAFGDGLRTSLLQQTVIRDQLSLRMISELDRAMERVVWRALDSAKIRLTSKSSAAQKQLIDSLVGRAGIERSIGGEWQLRSSTTSSRSVDREAPPDAVQPARRGGLVHIAAKPLERRQRVLGERGGEQLSGRIVAQPHDTVDRDESDHPRVERGRIRGACGQHQRPFADRSLHRDCERQDDPAAVSKAIEPAVERMRDTGVDENRVHSL